MAAMLATTPGVFAAQIASILYQACLRILLLREIVEVGALQFV